MIVIIDYGMGNTGSLVKIIRKVGEKAVVSSEKPIIEAADKYTTGVGSFDTGVKQLKERNLVDLLTEKIFHDKMPFLGICLKCS